MIKGFALVFFIGVVTSMFTAITASRTLLRRRQESKFVKTLLVPFYTISFNVFRKAYFNIFRNN